MPILVDKFSIFNQKLQLKIEIYLLWFFISPNLTYMQDYNVYKIFKMFSTLKSVQIFNFLCLRFNLARSREISQSREILLEIKKMRDLVNRTNEGPDNNENNYFLGFVNINEFVIFVISQLNK